MSRCLTAQHQQMELGKIEAIQKYETLLAHGEL